MQIRAENDILAVKGMESVCSLRVDGELSTCLCLWGIGDQREGRGEEELELV